MKYEIPPERPSQSIPNNISQSTKAKCFQCYSSKTDTQKLQLHLKKATKLLPILKIQEMNWSNLQQAYNKDLQRQEHTKDTFILLMSHTAKVNTTKIPPMANQKIPTLCPHTHYPITHHYLTQEIQLPIIILH